MQVTRRWWTAATLVTLLVVAGVVFAQPLLVVGGAGLGAWVLVQQILFVRTVVRAHDGLTVTQSLTRSKVTTDETTELVVDAALPPDCTELRPVRLDLAAGLPVGATSPSHAAHQLTLDDAFEATTTGSVEWPVAGHFQFNPPTVTVTDSQGFFESTFSAMTDAPPSITVVPRHPRNLHVGEGGERVASAFGDHKTGEFGLGLDPGEIREYTPGDTLRQIDWKATARSSVPHVREFDEETDRRTVLFVDHRTSMGTGRPGETTLDYARQVALGLVAHAQSEQEPIGLYTIGDAGITTRHPPDAGTRVYAKLQTDLHDLSPTHTSPSEQSQTRTPLASPTDARRKADTLQDDESAFATRFRPLFEAAETYVQRIANDPLYQTVRTHLTTVNGTVSTIIVTDDRNRAEVYETAKLAQNHRGEVLVFLAPTVLFENDGLTDVAAAYDQYTEFEDFRRELAQLDGVSAYELAPGDRLEALLATQSARHVARS